MYRNATALSYWNSVPVTTAFCGSSRDRKPRKQGTAFSGQTFDNSISSLHPPVSCVTKIHMTSVMLDKISNIKENHLYKLIPIW
jgi:hypothetical protein